MSNDSAEGEQKSKDDPANWGEDCDRAVSNNCRVKFLVRVCWTPLMLLDMASIVHSLKVVDLFAERIFARGEGERWGLTVY
jgi:hypothetical protein